MFNATVNLPDSSIQKVRQVLKDLEAKTKTKKYGLTASEGFKWDGEVTKIGDSNVTIYTPEEVGYVIHSTKTYTTVEVPDKGSTIKIQGSTSSDGIAQEVRSRNSVVWILNLLGLDFSNNSLFGDYDYGETNFRFLKPWQYVNFDTEVVALRKYVKNGGIKGLTEEESNDIADRYDDYTFKVVFKVLETISVKEKVGDIFKTLRSLRGSNGYKVIRASTWLYKELEGVKWEFLDFFGFRMSPGTTTEREAYVQTEKDLQESRVAGFKSIIAKYRPTSTTDKLKGKNMNLEGIKQSTKLKKNQEKAATPPKGKKPYETTIVDDAGYTKTKPQGIFEALLKESDSQAAPKRVIGAPVTKEQLLMDIKPNKTVVSGHNLNPSHVEEDMDLKPSFFYKEGVEVSETMKEVLKLQDLIGTIDANKIGEGLKKVLVGIKDVSLEDTLKPLAVAHMRSIFEKQMAELSFEKQVTEEKN